MITDVYAALDQPARLTVLSKPMLRAIGLFNRDVRELLSTYYQFDAPFIADHSAFTTAFGGHITDWDEIVQHHPRVLPPRRIATRRRRHADPLTGHHAARPRHLSIPTEQS